MEDLATKLGRQLNRWQIRVTILLSLICQIILIIFGSRRKYAKERWTRIIIWSAYISAHWVATVTLSVLARANYPGNSKEKTKDIEIHAFWAPFLLMHLGGPDTITAYSLEDNELWLRHVLGLIVQVGLASYVFILSFWSNFDFTFLAIPVLITGIIKYAERTFVLWSSSSKHLKESLLSPPDAGPDVFESKRGEMVQTELEVIPNEGRKLPKANSLMEVYFLFKRFLYLFSDLILGYHERTECYEIIQKKSAKEAFALVSTELGFLYDVLYTKATVIYSRWGILFRCINFFSSTCVLIGFSFIIIANYKHYSRIDIAITYLLLVWPVVLEVYSVILLVFSDWTRLWWSKLKSEKCCCCCPDKSSSDFTSTDNQKWSRSMAQYNLIKFCLTDNPAVTSIGVRIYQLLSKYLDLTWAEVNDDLQDIIFTQLKENARQIEGDHFSIEQCKQILAQRGDHALGKRGCLGSFEWSTRKIEFDHSLLLWHIATDICFHDDLDSHKDNSNRRISKCLSDYMLYLLIFCPNMLPKGIGEIRYRDTCEEAKRFFKQNKDKISNKSEVDEIACKVLLDAKVDYDSLEKIKGDKCQSVFFYAQRLAKQLREWKPEVSRGHESKWEMISEVWVELLMYAANSCEWKEHGQQLRRGGELLTHVRLLMVHLGLSEQYQIQRKYIFSPQHSWFGRIFQGVRSVIKYLCCCCQCFRCCCWNPCLCIHDCFCLSCRVVRGKSG